jgi:hypothetical protein
MAELQTFSEQGVIDLSLPTQADLSALQYHFVKLSSDLVVACGANEKPLGILQNAPDGSSDEATAKIRVQGLSYLSIGENVSFGDYLTSTAASKGEVADAAGEDYGARALGDYTAASQDAVVQVMFGEVEASDA